MPISLGLQKGSR